MNTDTLFTLCNFSVLPAWVLLLVAPRWKWTTILIQSAIIPLVLSGLYLVLALTNFYDGEGGFGTIEGVRLLFEKPGAMLAGWIHYLVFDLFIGCWEVRDSQRLNIPHLAVVPCLVLTFILGPVGLLLYFVLRWTLRREFIMGEERLGLGSTA